MVTEIFSFVGLLLLSVLLYLQHKKSSEQISELIKAVIAKTPREFIDMKQADKHVVDQPADDKEIPLSELTNSKWMETISKSEE